MDIATKSYFLTGPVVPSDPTVRLRVRPVDAEIWEAGHAEYLRHIREHRGKGDSVDVFFAAWRACARAMLEKGIDGWEGISIDGEPAEVSRDNVRVVAQNPAILDGAQSEYCQPWIERELEKNGLSPSRNIISKGAAADSNTAASGRTKRGAAKTATAPATPARSKSTNRKPPRAARSGAS